MAGVDAINVQIVEEGMTRAVSDLQKPIGVSKPGRYVVKEKALLLPRSLLVRASYSPHRAQLDDSVGSCCVGIVGPGLAHHLPSALGRKSGNIDVGHCHPVTLPIKITVQRRFIG